MSNISGNTVSLYSISQVNALTGVPKSTIRFWEKEFSDFLRPLRTQGNQRRYDHTDVETIQKIDKLVNEVGYTLDGARRQMSANGEKKTAIQEGVGDGRSNLAESMSNYLLKKLFEKVRAEEARRGNDFNQS